MNYLKYIPGFRSGNAGYRTIAIIYYSMMSLSCFLGLYDMERIIALVLTLNFPFAVFGMVDLVKGRYKKDFIKELILCIIPILIVGTFYTSLISRESENSFLGKFDSLKEDIRNYQSMISKEKEVKDDIDKGVLLDNILASSDANKELEELKKENHQMRTEIDGYKEELKKESYTSSSASSNNSYSAGSYPNNSSSSNSYSGGSSSNGSSSNNSYQSSSSSSNDYDDSYDDYDDYEEDDDYDSDYDHNHDDEEQGNHIGQGVYIANGNRYYHAISNCKYLEGAPTSYVTLTVSMNKFECNCWTNPVEYTPPTKPSSGSNNSGGRTVYIVSGNSYYHASSSCKFINGASATAVSINNVGSKHPCNCVKY